MKKSNPLSKAMIDNIVRMYLHPSRVVCILLTFSLSGYTRMYAQRVFSPFTETYEIKSGRNAEELLASDINGDGLTDLITYGGKNLYIHFQQIAPEQWRTVTIRIDQKIEIAVAARCNDDRFGDIVLLTEEPHRIEVLLGRPRDNMALAWRKWIGEPVRQMLIEDITNDGKPDLLMYGEKMLGIRVMAGNGNGTFQSVSSLFDEYPFNSVSVADMNDDGINDIIGSHWVMNQLLIYSGYGRMRFSDPVVVTLESEPLFISAAGPHGQDARAILVASSDPPSLQMLAGDGFGSYHPVQSLSLDAMPSQVAFSDTISTKPFYTGILSKDERSLTVLTNDVENSANHMIKFSAGKRPESFVFFRHDTSAFTDAAVFDADTRKIRVYVNANARQFHQRKNVHYLTGYIPGELFSFDVDNDLDNDVIVANRGSGTVSLLRNAGAGIFDAQVSFSTLNRPEHIQMLRQKDSLITFFVTAPSVQEYSQLDFNSKTYSTQTFSLPFRKELSVAPVLVDSRTNQKRFFAFESDIEAGTISLFEIQLSGSRRLTEHNCVPSIPASITGVSIDDMDDNGSPDILYLRYNSEQKSQDIYRMSETKPRQFSSPVLMYPAAVRESTGAVIWHHDINGDMIKDIIINFSEPENTLRFFLTRSDTSLSESKTRIRDVFVETPNDIQITDANGDGIIDVVVKNHLQKSIQLYAGRGDGTFLPRTRLISTEGIGGFTVSDIDNDDVPELLYTDMVNGTLKILSFNAITR